MRIVPDAGVKIVIDPKRLQLDTTGDVRVILTAPEPVGDVVLFHGSIHRDLSKVVPGTDLFDFGPEFKPTILGFDTGSKIAIRLEKDGVHVPVDVKLPPAFGGFSGHIELVADRETGLHVDSVHIHIGPVLLGALVINSIDLDYVGGDDLWTGKGSITVPAGGTLDLEAQFAMGAFKSASFSFKPGTPIPIGPFVYLLQFGGGFEARAGDDQRQRHDRRRRRRQRQVADEGPRRLHDDLPRAGARGLPPEGHRVGVHVPDRRRLAGLPVRRLRGVPRAHRLRASARSRSTPTSTGSSTPRPAATGPASTAASRCARRSTSR